MSKHEHAENDAAEPRRPWQFGLIHLLLLPAAWGLRWPSSWDGILTR